jgi:hypothetical protein
MIPSQKWFPSSLAERAAWFQNFSDKFATLASGLGFLPSDVTAVAGDNDAFQFLASSAVDIDTFSKGITAYRKEVTEGSIGDPPAELPVPPTWTAPPTAKVGLFERLDDLVKRIRVAPNYSSEEGQQLGIVPSSSTNGKSSLDDSSPALKARTLPGNVVEVTFVRGVSDGIALEMRVDNDMNWVSTGNFGKSPADFVVPANPNNLPRSVALRARFLNGNKPVGLYSDVVNVVTTP